MTSFGNVSDAFPKKLLNSSSDKFLKCLIIISWKIVELRLSKVFQSSSKNFESIFFHCVQDKFWNCLRRLFIQKHYKMAQTICGELLVEIEENVDLSLREVLIISRQNVELMLKQIFDKSLDIFDIKNLELKLRQVFEISDKTFEANWWVATETSCGIGLEYFLGRHSNCFSDNMWRGLRIHSEQ